MNGAPEVGPQFLPVGTRVQWSEYHLRSSRDYYLGLGREPAKSRAKDEYERQRAMRGTIDERTFVRDEIPRRR